MTNDTFQLINLLSQRLIHLSVKELLPLMLPPTLGGCLAHVTPQIFNNRKTVNAVLCREDSCQSHPRQRR